MTTLKWALILIGLIILIPTATGVYLFNKTITVVQVNKHIRHVNPVAIPPLLDATVTGDEKQFVDMILQEGKTAFFKGKYADTWGVNGSFLGPTIRIRTGQIFKATLRNTLPEATTIHWHGAHVPPSMDGGPHQIIMPQQEWNVQFPIVQQAATLWYHPHMMGKTAEHVYKGIAGFFIIDDETDDSLDLPNVYGVDDIPLVIQDRAFDARGNLIYDHDHNSHEITTGMLGDTILVNGTYNPYLSASRKLIRLRLLNGSNARRYNFGFNDNRMFYQIASDGGFLEKPVELTRLQLSPGERAEILIDLTAQKEPLLLKSYAINPEPNAFTYTLEKIIAGDSDKNQEFNILQIRPSGEPHLKQIIPQELTTINRYKKTEVIKKRNFRLNAAAINDMKMDITRVDEVVQKGDLELWTIRNASSLPHPFHIHGTQFQILSRNGKPPAAHEAGWKDTVAIPDSEVVELAMKFNQYSDPTLPYMYHCHTLEHEDMGMMGQFVVIEKSTEKVRVQTPAYFQNGKKHTDSHR